MIPRLIGDIHGDIRRYHQILGDRDYDFSIQVGDFGFGFSVDHYPAEIFPSPRDYFIRGNHDSPESCRQVGQEHHIRDGSYWPRGYGDGQGGIAFLGGAYSIDKACRKEGLSWWPNEECNDETFAEFIHSVRKWEPELIATHDCPQFIATSMFGISHSDQSKTRGQLQRVWDSYAPKLWVFGHWHPKNVQMLSYGRSVFICLPEFGHVDLRLGN